MLHLLQMFRVFAVIVFALLLGLRVTWADSGLPATATILVGKSFTFTLTSNYPSGNQYDTGASDALTVAVAPNPLPTGPSCTWTVTGVTPGISQRAFTWYNPAHPNDSGFFTCTITVLARGSTTGNDGHVVAGGDPVNTRNGELFGLENMDFNLGGPLPLRLERYYASAMAADGKVSSALGANRAHNFDMKLVTDGSTLATVTTSRGRIVIFSGKLGNWTLVLPTDIPYQLVKNGVNYRFADPASRMQFVFDATGKLNSIEDGRGNALTLTYTGTLLTSVSDGLGRMLTFGYTGTNLTSVSDGTRNVTFTYSGSNLATATDPSGHTTTYAYDANHFLTSVMRPLGNVPISQSFTSSKVTTQTQRGADTTFAYGSGTTTETDPASATQTYGFATTGTPTSITDAAGKSLTMGNDATGRWSSVTDRLGRTTTIAFHTPSGLLASVTRPDGGTTSNLYTPRHLTTGLTFYDRAKVTYPDTTIQTFTHDASGNLLQSNDSLGHITRYTYNTRGQPLTITNALGGVTTFTYDNLTGRLTSMKDSDTLPDNFTYDGFSRLIQIAHPDSTTRNFSYSPTDQLTTETDELGGVTTLVYDDNNRLTGVTDTLGHTSSIVYDTSDTPVSFTDRRGKTRAQTYNTRSLVDSTTDPLLNATTLDYDARRRLTKVTDPLSNQTALGYDDEARLTSIADPLNHTTSFARDVLGRVSAASDALGHTTLFTHDLRLRPTVQTDALGRQTHWTYDKTGQLVAAARDGLPAAAYTRDALGDVTQIKDPNGGLWKYTYTKMGRLASATDPLLRKMSYAYDSRGRLITISHPDGGTATISYNGVSRVTGLVGSDGTAMGFGYDADNRLTSATTGTAGNDIALTLDEEGNIINSAQGGFNFGATYDDDGRLASLTYAGALTVNYTYDAAGRLASVSDTSSGGTVGFNYDAAGRPTTVTRTNGVTTTFTFDNANRLTKLQHGTVVDLTYSLNAAGDVAACGMTAPLTPAVVLGAKTFKFDKAAQILNAAGTDSLPVSGNFAYDARGRLITTPAYGFSWNAFSRLTKIADPAAGASVNDRTFTYDAFGATVTRAIGPAGAPTARTRYFHHHALRGAPVIAESDDLASAFVRYYICTPGGQLIYSVDAGTNVVHFYHSDRNGSELALTDMGGTVTDSYAYGPYGELLARSGSSTQPFRWLGAWSVRTDVLGAPASENSASVFYDVHARWLDPATSRFLSRDPAGPRLADVRTLDPYQYAFGDPATYIDRTGVDPEAGGTTNNPNNQPGVVSAGASPNIGGVVLHIFAPGSYDLSLNFPPSQGNGFSTYLDDDTSLESTDLRNLFDASIDVTSGKLEIGASVDFGLEQRPETFDEERQKSRYLWAGVSAYLKATLADSMYYQAHICQPTNASTLLGKATNVMAGSTAAGTGNAEATFAYQFAKGIWLLPEARIDLNLQHSTAIATASANASGGYTFDNIEEGVTYRIAPADLSPIFDRPN